MQLRRFNQPELVKQLSVCILSLCLLFCGFLFNGWRVADAQWFKGHQRDTESLIVGRMIKSRQDGIFSAGGLTGAGMASSIQQQWVSSEQIQQQYSAYLNRLTFEAFSPYMSQIGGQGMLFSVFDRLLPLSPQTKLTAFYVLTSLLSATALMLIIRWFYSEFGLSVAVWVTGSAVFSQWLTVFGRNLWWSMWGFYLPMIAVMYFLRSNRLTANRHFITFGILIFISVLVKCFINGYEYITTTLAMMMTPFIYYSLIERAGVRRFLKGCLTAVVGSGVAIFLSLTVLAFQIGAVKGGIGDGFEHIVYSLGKRTHGNAADFPEVYAASLHAGTVEVVTTYLLGTFFDINNYFKTSHSSVSNALFKIRYVYLVVLFLVASVLVFYRRDDNISEAQHQRYTALIATTWFSMLAPLSWYVVFKAHSYIHTHMSYLLWQMPFTLFGFAVCGLVVKRGFSFVAKLNRAR